MSRKKGPKLEILQEFNDVFLHEVLGIPPKRDIHLSNDLLFGATLVSKTSYRMSTLKLIVSKMQIARTN